MNFKTTAVNLFEKMDSSILVTQYVGTKFRSSKGKDTATAGLG